MSDRGLPMRDAAAPDPIGPACPQNWYLVARSGDVKRGAIVERRLGDIEIVLYRGQSGCVVALAAHCAHAGCHLRHGKVVGDDLRCALHHRTIRTDGRFIAKDGRLLDSPPQSGLPAVERFECIFVFAGKTATFDLPMPEICAQGPITTCTLPSCSFPLPWSTLIANGMDIDHLQAVHDRKLCAPPTLRRLDKYSLRLDYRARVTGTHLGDRAMKWLSSDDIQASITCVGGSMMIVQSRVGRYRTFVILSMCPVGRAGSVIRAVVGVTGAPSRIAPRLSARLAAWLFHAFLKKDVGILQQMDWHEPEVEITLGDSLTRSIGKFFRSLPAFERLTSPPTPASSRVHAAGGGP
jgi:nitrite reductase/ring-hydroxylating ferredoxin subunit